MSNSNDSRLPQPLRSHRAAFAANSRQVRQLWRGIFAELLPQITKEPLAASSPRPSLLYPDSPAGTKEARPMHAYLTESPYYFSSKQLLPTGSLVFFSEKLRRYVHPTDGVLLDSYPRLQALSETDSQALEVRWREALARY